MIQPIKTITILGPAVSSAYDFFRQKLPTLCGGDEVVPFDKVIVDFEGNQCSPTIEHKDGKLILKVDPANGQRLFNKLIKQKGLKENEDYIKESEDKYIGLSPHEQSVQDAIKTVDEILARAYDRRTNVSSWALFLVLRYFGFKGEDGKSSDDYEPIRKTLTGENGLDFVRKYANYLRLKETDEQKAKEFIQKAFEGDEDKERKDGLVSLVSFVMDLSKKISVNFLERVPLLYSIQNLAMPILANIVKKGPFGKLFHVMRLVNPWIGEFMEWFANFKKELTDLLKIHEEIDDPFRRISEAKEDSPKDEKSNASDFISEMDIIGLNKEQYGLKKVVTRVNEVFDRILGRKTSLSSWILNGILRWFGKDYQSFTSEFTGDQGFIEDLCEHLKEVKQCVENKQEEPKLSEEKFDGAKYYIAKIVKGAVSIANALPESFITTTSNILGLVFGTQNLFMPILAECFKEGKLKSFICFMRDINPVLNDLVDYVANFRKEILEVRRENANIQGLLPKLSKEMVYDAVVGNLKSLWKTIRQFGGKVFGKKELKIA